MSEWSIFGIEPTSDKREIKRAYAKVIKTIDPGKEPARFQEVREAYDYLLNYGRHYVDEENLEQTENAQDAIFIDEDHSSEILIDESTDTQTDLDTKAALSEQTLIQDNKTLSTHSNHGNPQLEDDVTFELASSNHSAELEVLDNSERNELVHSSIELQQQELATDFPQKTSYQSANEFVDRLDRLFRSETTVDRSKWVELIEDHEYQFFDIIEQLRIDVFGYLVHQVESNTEAGNQPEKLKLKLLRERLPKDFEWLVKYLAEHFDWQNTELILSNHFGGEQMKLLGQFYLRNVTNQPVNTIKGNSNSKHYFFWIIFLFVLVKIFSAMDKGSDHKGEPKNQQKTPVQLDSKDPDIFCSHLKLISNDKRAIKCEELLQPIDGKRRVLLSFYWFNRFDMRNQNNSEEELEPILDRAFGFLESASKNEYLPAMNLLAWIKLGKHYQRQDIPFAKQLLQRASDIGDLKSRLALAVGYYSNFWGKKDLQEVRRLYKSVDVTDKSLSANLKYVLAVGQWLGLKPARQNQSQAGVKKQAKIIFKDFSHEADLEYVNSIAWYFATANDQSFDPVLAVNLARQFQPGYRGSKNWQHIDTLAAAYAARGNFEEALEYIQSAENLVKNDYPDIGNSNRDEALATLQKHKAIYNQRKRLELAPENQALQFVLNASFKSLMYIDTNNLPN